MYYFDTTLDDEFEKRIFCIEGDITDSVSLKALKNLPYKTLINCAACVKHFAANDILERINVIGVASLIELCESNHTRLIQISTSSIAGERIGNQLADHILHENELYFGQILSNKYIHSK